jgi:outer membrane protein
MARLRNQCILLALLISNSTLLAAADLLGVYHEALKSDPVYSAARANWTAFQEKRPQGLAALLPQASFSASTQQNDRRIQSRTPGTAANLGQFNSNSMSVSITQPIYRKQSLVAYEQGKTQVAIADAQFAQAGQDLILRVAQAYFDVLLANDNVAFAGAQKEAIGQQLAQAKRNFEVGNATITDTHEAQARYDLVTSQEIAALNELEVKRRTLAQLTGRDMSALKTLGNNFRPESPEPQNIGQWVERATRSSPAVRAAIEGLALATQEVERNRGGHHPTVDAFASHTNSGAGSNILGGAGSDTRSTVYGLQMAIPLYQGGGTVSRVREALANEEKARQDLENARRSSELAARSGYLGVTSGLAQVNALEAALLSSQSSLDSTRLGQEVGVRTQVDVLNAQQQLFSARRDLAQARYNYILSRLRLQSAAGNLTENELQRVNRWLTAQ